MIKITFFGNCQASTLANMFLELFANRMTVNAVYNNPKSGHVLSNEATHKLFDNSDIIIYQPLSEQHYFSDAYIRTQYADKVLISFPYLYSTGFAGLINKDDTNSDFYGLEPFLSYLNENERELRGDLVIKNSIFEKTNILERFESSLQILKAREVSCDIKTSEFINENIRGIPLFDTRNHPTYPLFRFIAEQIIKILSWNEVVPKRSLAYPGLPKGVVCISPADAEVMGFEYGYHSNWLQVYTSIFQRHTNSTVRLVSTFSHQGEIVNVS